MLMGGWQLYICFAFSYIFPGMWVAIYSFSPMHSASLKHLADDIEAALATFATPIIAQITNRYKPHIVNLTICSLASKVCAMLH